VVQKRNEASWFTSPFIAEIFLSLDEAGLCMNLIVSTIIFIFSTHSLPPTCRLQMRVSCVCTGMRAFVCVLAYACVRSERWILLDKSVIHKLHEWPRSGVKLQTWKSLSLPLCRHLCDCGQSGNEVEGRERDAARLLRIQPSPPASKSEPLRPHR
jgi:hypothetical protein